ncbi:nucleotidyltransferase domain-containing protein [Pedobacter frigidisoli]|uniref:Nucleotidyltransferase domain-containing protein n=1 Tax=Pedobacter frigidisoli TaxID=2530455 RepID=A0A4R0PA33_9SPHI|nr:nucleotidyltransferase domain-containing protein [Pedobacter frigidisoli]TCD12638.1 nucleotidyltransferase domain-containing protein [Pedobacter frigidisoli]
MKTTIIKKLEEIEKANDITILFACESGSRGWEFPSPDSDYDVRFIYVRPLNYYLSVLDKDDQLRFPINEELDIYGWDIRKVLKLIRKSNTTPFEWLQSPIIYREKEKFRDDLWQLCQSYFYQKNNINHYLGIAHGALETIINDDEIKIKKLFYILRPLLSAKWCLEKGTIAPMTISPLLTLMPEKLQTIVKDLIDLKSTSAEGFIIKINAELKTYINEQFELCGNGAKDLPKESFDLEKLDIFFRNTISRYDN